LEPQTGTARNVETVLHMKDGLPKLKNFPKALAARVSNCRSNAAAQFRSRPTYILSSRMSVEANLPQ